MEIKGYEQRGIEPFFTSIDSFRVGSIDDECRKAIVVQKQIVPTTYEIMGYMKSELENPSEDYSRKVASLLPNEAKQEIISQIMEQLSESDPEEENKQWLAFTYGIINDNNLLSREPNPAKITRLMNSPGLRAKGLGGRFSARVRLRNNLLPEASDISYLASHKVTSSETLLMESPNYSSKELTEIYETLAGSLTSENIRNMPGNKEFILIKEFQDNMQRMFSNATRIIIGVPDGCPAINHRNPENLH